MFIFEISYKKLYFIGVNDMNKKIAFYLMNEKGFYILNKFIEKFGAENIKYIVSSKDIKLKKDYFKEIKQLCKKHNINFFDRTDDYIQQEKFFLGYKFAIGWRWIVKNSNNLIVFHDSLLPKYRGFAPLVNTLVNGDKIGGVTALLASSQYDRGDIISQKAIQFDYPIKISEAIENIKPLYFDLVSNIYSSILEDKILPRQKQDESKATYSLWLDDKDYFIDWHEWSAKKIKRFVDATDYPYDNAKAYLSGKIVRFMDVEVLDDVKVEHRKRHIGKVIFMDEYPIVVCKKGLLKLIDIRDDKDNNLIISFRSRFE